MALSCLSAKAASTAIWMAWDVPREQPAADVVAGLLPAIDASEQMARVTHSCARLRAAAASGCGSSNPIFLSRGFLESQGNFHRGIEVKEPTGCYCWC